MTTWRSPARARAAPTLVAVALLGLWGCSWFEDPSPENVFLRMTGETGTEVRLVLSTQFVFGTDEVGTTQVRLVQSDTILRPLPVDTMISVAVDRRFFVEAVPAQPDTVEVQVRVDVDDRGLYDRRGLVFQEVPFRFVYLFNRTNTTNVDEVL